MEKNEKLRVIFIGAHPDDEGFCSGTLAKYVKSGHEVTIISATKGERGHYKIPPEELKEIRTNELKNVAKILGAKVMFLDYEDASVPPPHDMRDAFVNLLRKLRPNIVITWHPYTDRDDHRNIGQAVYDACFKSSLPLVKTEDPFITLPRIYFIGEPVYPSEPNLYVDITSVIKIKIEAVKAHKSQLEEWIPWSYEMGTGGKIKPDLNLIINYFVKQRGRKYGLASGVKYAEEFRIIGSGMLEVKAKQLLPYTISF